MLIVFILWWILAILCVLSTIACVAMYIDVAKQKQWSEIAILTLPTLLIIGISVMVVGVGVLGVNRCESCGAYSFLNDYCSDCGEQIRADSLIECSECHKSNWYTNKYCTHCGNELQKGE